MTVDQIKAAFESYRTSLPAEVQLLFDGLLTLVGQQQQLLDKQQELLEKQQVRLQELEDRLAKNSINSSKPPSSDPPGVKRTQSLRKKSKKKPGGQYGHKGHKLELSARVDEVIHHRLDLCPDCGSSLKEQPVEEVIRKQIWDIPPLAIHVVEHQVEIKTCSCCGTTWQAGGLPAHIRQEVAYGPGIKALGVYLQCHHHLPMQRSCDLMTDLFSLPLSQGSLANFIQSAHQRLSGFEQSLQSRILESPSCHFDETGVRLQQKNFWLHTSSTSKYALFRIHAARGRKAMDDIGILPHYQGTAHHDALSSYLKYSNCRHSLCNAHLLRELIFVEEQYEQSWAAELKALLCRIKSSADWSATGFVDIRWQGRYRKAYRQLVAQGMFANPPPEKIPGKKGRTAKTKARNLLERLENHENNYLRFMADPYAAFDNNQAERDLRMNKVKMKVSGCFRNEQAAHAFARIRSFLLTAQKQSVNVLEALKDVFSPMPVFYLNLVS